MILERSMDPGFLSNTYLVAAGDGSEAFFVDAGGPMAPLFDAAERHGLRPTHILLTHHHYDHVSQIAETQARYGGGLTVLVPESEAQFVDEATGTWKADDTLTIGGLQIRTHAIPGHTSGMIGIEVLDPAGGPSNVFTGDTLFKNSVGGVRAPDSTSYSDLKHSVMDVLMALPPQTILRPGHIEETTVGAEWDGNSFIRVWRGLDPEDDRPCTALGEPATLVHLGDDYDGGHKAWVRWPDGRDDIVPGSKVELTG